MKNKNSSQIKLWAVLIWLTLWQIGSLILDNKILLVSPIEVLKVLTGLILIPSFWLACLFSFVKIVGGFFAACIFGSILAALGFRFRWIYDLLMPLVTLIKTIPVASFIILALIWFPSKNLSFLISFLMVLPIIYTNIYTGMSLIDKSLTEVAYVFKVTFFRRLKYIYLPGIYPFFKSACSIALGLCWKAGVAAEVIGMPKNSIGENLQQAKVFLDTPYLFAWTLVIIILSVGFEKLFIWAISINKE